MKPLTLLALVLVVAASPTRAADKNGLSVIVSKVLLESKDVRGAWTTAHGTHDANVRTYALKIVLKNISFKPLPEGDLEWKVVVIGDQSSVLYSGNEKVTPLKPANTQEVQVGSAAVTGWRSLTGKGQDKLEWQVVVKQGDKEIIKTQSTPNLEALATRAAEDMARILREKSSK